METLVDQCEDRGLRVIIVDYASDGRLSSGSALPDAATRSGPDAEEKYSGIRQESLVQKRAVRQIVGSGILLAIFFATLALLGRAGAEGRVLRTSTSESPPVAVRVVQTSQELLGLWRQEGVRGRRLVHASRFLHFVPVEDDSWFEDLDRFPIETFDLTRRFEESVDARNLLWVSLRIGTSRAVDHVLPPAVMDEKLAQIGRPIGVGGQGRRELVVYDHGSSRVIADQLPSIAERVLLSIDASYLESIDPARVLADLRRSGLEYDLLVLCRSEDNPDVTEASRQRMDQLAAVVADRR
jgi:hypothetical protein